MGLQSGMRGAYGKSYGKACRVKIGTRLISIRCRAQHVKYALEALRRAKMKFPGRQKIAISRLVGFTKFTAEQIEDLKATNRLKTQGSHISDLGVRGKLSHKYPEYAEDLE